MIWVKCGAQGLTAVPLRALVGEPLQRIDGLPDSASLCGARYWPDQPWGVAS